MLTASDPSISVLLSASAGTGKTHILINRILRLLLSGVTFDKILCLTFTNVAIHEIDCRIKLKLMFWSLCSNTKLKFSITT